MRLNTVIARIPFWYAARKCVYLKSPPGMGKTTTIVQAPVILSQRLGKNIGLVVINGPLLTPPDSIGYLVPTHEGGHHESVYTEPFWYRTAEGKRLDEYDGGIIFVDEADKMDSDVKKVIGEAALSGRLGPHVLPPGWVVWMAGNRSEDRSGSTKELDHLINRRLEIDLSIDVDSWEDWSLVNGVSPICIAFAKNNTHIVFQEKVPEKQGPWCTPRSLVEMDRYFQILAGKDGDYPSDSNAIEEANGMIGQAASAQYFAYVRLDQEMPKFDQIVAAPATVKVPTKPDAQMLVAYNLAHRVSKETATPVIQYMDRMPKEFAVTFAKAACKRDHNLVTTPGFQAWSRTNSALMAAIAT